MQISELYKDIMQDLYYRDIGGERYIVRLRLKYSWETEYEYYNIILEYEDGVFTWEWDFDEGQDIIEILDYVNIDDIFIKYKIEEVVGNG